MFVGIISSLVLFGFVASSTSSKNKNVVASALSMSATSSSPSTATATTIKPPTRFRTWPITATKSIEPQLKQMGLQIPAECIDGTTTGRSGGSNKGEEPKSYLSDALVSVGTAGRGGTGSFVSGDGLILTNWHVAYDAVRKASLLASTDEKTIDYVRDGYVAQNRGEEIVGPDYEVWITKSCVDVSDQIVSVLSKEKDPLKRSNKVRDIMQEIAQTSQQEQRRRQRQTNNGDSNNTSDDEEEENGGDGGIRCDVQEMLPNESYVLFTYERLRDVRIVYVPPKSLGNFGGDHDNFEWPRHTADFTLLRAYVGPDGIPADYSPENIPYKPTSVIPTCRHGANEGDMVFLLGFPGLTMRYAPSPRLQYSDSVSVPNDVADFTRKLQLIAQHEKTSTTAALKLGSTKKGLANELKRSRGKLVMMRKLQLLQERINEEDELCNKYNNNNKNNKNDDDNDNPRKVLDRLSEIYDIFKKNNEVTVALEACRGIYGGSSLLAAGHAIHEYVTIEALKFDNERESTYRKRNLPFLFTRLAKRISDIHVPNEVDLIRDAIGKLKSENHPELKSCYGEIVEILDNGDIEKSVLRSTLFDQYFDSKAFDEIVYENETGNPEAMVESTILSDDPFVMCAEVLYGLYAKERDQSKALLSERDELLAKLLDYQREYNNNNNNNNNGENGGEEAEIFYPDCNGSLRISAGHVEGYDSADAVFHKPKTTLSGLFDKATEAKLSSSPSNDGGGEEENEFDCPDRLYEMLSSPTKQQSSSSSSSDDNNNNVHNVPVCLLYSTDTVGGNSGSPVMNSKGELIGINFDRQRQGLMNEYKWSKDYSRSIGVDVRYILWLVGTYDNADHLVREMLSS